MAEAKNIKVVIPAADREHGLDVRILPGATVRTIKSQVPALREMCLFRSHNSLPCREQVDLYASTRDGDIFYAATYQDVGMGSLYASVKRFFAQDKEPFGNPPVRSIMIPDRRSMTNR